MLVLIQVTVNIVLTLGVLFLWIRGSRRSGDDPRLSRGLQLLQGKITVLEDLSDRSETQVRQLTLLLDQKTKQVQEKLEAAEKTLERIALATQRSLEVAEIFQDKIPHHEIIERQNTIKHVQAAKLAHEGRSVDEIAAEVDLDRGEIELIAKLNREQLMFDTGQLPAWVDMGRAFEKPPEPSESLRALGENFRKSLAGFQPESTRPAPPAVNEVEDKIKAVDWRTFSSNPSDRMKGYLG
jgi:hypothetical protein